MKTLQKFSSVRTQVQNHFNQERHLVTRQVLQAKTLDCIGGVARTCRVEGGLRAGVSPYASANPITLTTSAPQMRVPFGRPSSRT
jgi:hypothetical protein